MKNPTWLKQGKPGVLVYSRTIPQTLFPSKAVIERIWQSLLRGYGSNHSAYAETLIYIVNRCEREGQAYRLTALPNMGYFVEFLGENGKPIERKS